MTAQPPPPAITLVGLGPGSPDLLTRQAWETLCQAPEVYLRTRQHPVVAALPAGPQFHSFDDLYDSGLEFEAVYAAIVERVMALGRRPQGVIYAVPGHPLVAEATGSEIIRRARQEGLSVRIVEGLSFLEPVCSALGLDPFPRLTLVDALELATGHVPLFPPDAPALAAQLYARDLASEVKLTLMAIYPDEHPVQLIHAAGTPEQVVEHLALFEIDRSPHIGLLTVLHIPPLAAATSFYAFQEVMAHLRAPDGCPWDREQTHLSMRQHMLEEAYEVVDALDKGDLDALREELGDLLLNILMQAQIASENGDFNMAQVIAGIHSKIVSRHPHVFAEVDLKDAQAVLANWERLKAGERLAKGKTEAGALDGVPLALPALVQAQEYQKRAARLGFDWPDVQGVLDKVDEEVEEVRRATSDAERAAEIGDLLFILGKLARSYEIDAESALREANARFRQRFSGVEAAARRLGRPLNEMEITELLELWQQAKGED